ncbi:MAG TPA: tRNA dihydrouridine synthase DusB [Candidatus Choladousia intestinavium]|uniref:tRNA-dihydrouridine synthase n=1 Tax=Candidatus Choladousia intestinavium TaxID=2840727 RepID=A0A9D1DAD6_9FIRM|nr:tRNA dihydrouridine synthase DusB [Candidatus Choladousia intestinavium]
MKIGTVQLKNPVILAPMAGVTDLPFRLLCSELGAGLVCTEMVSAKAISFHNRNTEALLQIDPGEHPVSLQLFGSDPDIISEMASYIEERPFDILDLNMGCPVPKVVKNGEGSALLNQPRLVEEIISKTVRAIKKPVTVKIRKGFEDGESRAAEIARIAEASGAAAVAVHGRTRSQYYAGRADWQVIREVKEAVKIPVIGNGDVDSPGKAKELFEETGCDGVMIGRAARGNPWIFKEVSTYLATGTIPERPSKEEIRNMMFRHMEMQVEYRGEYSGIREMRKHISWYTAGFPNSAKLRQAVNQAETAEQMRELLYEKF